MKSKTKWEVERAELLAQFGDEFREVWAEFLLARKSIRKPATPYAEVLILRDCAKWKAAHGERVALRAVSESAKHCWQDVRLEWVPEWRERGVGASLSASGSRVPVSDLPRASVAGVRGGLNYE